MTLGQSPHPARRLPLHRGPGLTNPLGADVHLVLRDHGPVQDGLFRAALGSYGGGCIEAPEGSGTLGDYACVDLQFATHEPTLGA